ncbi:MAG: ABC transporter substrate-binding protein [Parvibaculaceae bacterium]
MSRKPHETAMPGLGRRDFLKLAMAAGTSLATAQVLWSKRARAEPKKGGRLRAGLAHGSTTDVLDPATYENGFTQTIGNSVYNRLTEVGPAGELVGELAQSWEPSADARTWRFKLRSGVQFHNGKTLDSGDVVASINHHRGEASTSGAKGIVAEIVDLKADGADGVTVTLKGGNADFPFILSDFHLGIFPAAEGKIDWASGIGTGAYAIASFEPGIRANLKRNGNYWKDGRGHFDEVELMSIVDVNARTNALVGGDIDVMDRCDLKTVNLLKRNANIRVEQSSGTQHYSFAMHTDADPFTSRDVRLALKLAIDRQELVDKILLGYGYLGNDHPIGKSNRYFAGDLAQRSYDPDQARFLLKKAGHDTLKVSLSVADAAFAGAVDAGTLFAEKARKAGITIDVVREPDDGYWTNVWLKKPFAAVYWGGRPTEDWMFSTAYAAGVPWNDTHWASERFNTLLQQARVELDDGKRRRMYGEMQHVLSDDGGAIIPMFANFVFAMSDKVAHAPEISADWDLDGLKFAERWWFA